MTNEPPRGRRPPRKNQLSRRRLKKWKTRAAYIMRRSDARGDEWALRQADLMAPACSLVRQLGYAITRHGSVRADLAQKWRPRPLRKLHYGWLLERRIAERQTQTP